MSKPFVICVRADHLSLDFIDVKGSKITFCTLCHAAVYISPATLELEGVPICFICAEKEGVLDSHQLSVKPNQLKELHQSGTDIHSGKFKKMLKMLKIKIVK